MELLIMVTSNHGGDPMSESLFFGLLSIILKILSVNFVLLYQNHKLKKCLAS